MKRRLAARLVLGCAIAAATGAVVGRARAPAQTGGRTPSIRIVDVRPSAVASD